MQPVYAYFSLLWVHVFEVTNFFKTFNSFSLMLNKRPSVGTQLYPFMVSRDDKGRLILSGAKESGLV